MESFHRKILQKPTKLVVVVKHCSSGDCDDNKPLLPPSPPLPPPPLSSAHTLSRYLIFMFCGLAVSFLFICYLMFVKRYQSRRLRDRQFNANRETHQDFVNEDLGPVIDHPIWLINTVGLDQSQIESIHVFKYKKDESLIEGTDCSVCLSEFEDDESLRLLPKCNHAFHVPCIDTWLRSHKNCPLCRAPIIKNTSDQTTIESNSTEYSNTNEETEIPVVGSETSDHQHVVEVENNVAETEKTFGIVNERGVRVQSDLADHRRAQGVELPAMMRRSFSYSQLVVASKRLSSMPKSVHKLKGSSSSIHIRSKVMKSSSFGHSSRKATSSTNKNPYNRSY